MKNAILAIGLAVVLWVGWPQPHPSHHDSSLISPAVRQTIASRLSSIPDTSRSSTEVLKLSSVETEEEDLQLPYRPLVVDLNLGSRRELDTLPGIGMKLADRIVVYRSIHGSFQQVEDLLNISGIGEKRLRQLKPFVIVETKVGEQVS